MTTAIELNEIFAALPAEVQADAREIGRAWAEQEVECWQTQHGEDTEGPRDASDMPEWTMGTYCGVAPQIPGVEMTEEQAEAIDYAIDCAAREVWNAARG